MSSSMYTVSPASLHDLSDRSNNYAQHTHRIDEQPIPPHHPHNGPVTPESHLLSPYSSHIQSNSASPTLNSTTPGDAASGTECYQPGELFAGNEYANDPFLGANFDDVWYDPTQAPDDNDHIVYPLSPRPTPSMPAHQTFQPNTQTVVGIQNTSLNKGDSAQQELSIDSVDSSQSDPQLTPDTNRDSWSSNESPAQDTSAMAIQSPRVTVSMWGKDNDAPVQGVERSFSAGPESPHTVRPSHSIAGDLALEQPYEGSAHISRGSHGDWIPNASTGHRGLAPEERPSETIISPNQQASRREIDKKNREVDAWITRSTGNVEEFPGRGERGADPSFANAQEDEDDNIPLGHETENRHQEGQTYFMVDDSGGRITETDFNIMRSLRTWADAPIVHAIQADGKRYQPETSQDAINRFHRQCQDNASIVSKAATWGTRRRSLPSVMDIEGITSGNFLKKLSISGGHSRRPSLLQRVTSISRKTNISGYRNKRKGSNASEVPPEECNPTDRRESKDNLALPSRTSSWGLNKKPSSPIGVLVSMANGAATFGTHHVHSGSISATPITSPKSPLGNLSVPHLRRPRSKSDLPKTSNADISHPNLIEMWKKQGGPPVAQPARLPPNVDQDEEEDDDDDGGDENDLRVERGKSITIEPTLNGFKAHILEMNPGLAAAANGVENPNGYLVDRIAYQLQSRYKQLLTAKQKHIGQAGQQECPSGVFCPSRGGTIKYSDNRGGDRGVDPFSARALSSDDEVLPPEGGINAESFPPGITLPPATSLPAQFECPLCFNVKKFQKPSDWTKHVHEDVQPFTCTWDRCRDPKMFKRKADWVRHENEGHRHLEWWTCDVEDCRHVCYRRDNFLQHLVREHKFAEPKIKTKAAIKKAGGVDITWQKVEQCHEETKTKPMDEPCRFCGKICTSWKKLTVHLAKHMEQISLPLLEMVLAKDLDSDTIISPVQDPPPRHFGIPVPPTTPLIKPDPQDMSPQIPQTSANMANYHATNTIGFSPIPQAPMRTAFYNQHNAMAHPQYSMQHQYQEMPVTTAVFGQPGTAYALGIPIADTEPFPAFDSLGIQDAAGTIGYQNLGNPALHGVEHYGSNQGSVSPYAHSPHQGHNTQFYNQ